MISMCLQSVETMNQQAYSLGGHVKLQKEEIAAIEETVTPLSEFITQLQQIKPRGKLLTYHMNNTQSPAQWPKEKILRRVLLLVGTRVIFPVIKHPAFLRSLHSEKSVIYRIHRVFKTNCMNF